MLFTAVVLFRFQFRKFFFFLWNLLKFFVVFFVFFLFFNFYYYMLILNQKQLTVSAIYYYYYCLTPLLAQEIENIFLVIIFWSIDQSYSTNTILIFLKFFDFFFFLSLCPILLFFQDLMAFQHIRDVVGKL